MRNTNINRIANEIRFSADVSMQRINAPQQWHLPMCSGAFAISCRYQVGDGGIVGARFDAPGVDDSTSKRLSSWLMPVTTTVTALLTGCGNYLLRLERRALEVFASPISGHPTLTTS